MFRFFVVVVFSTLWEPQNQDITVVLFLYRDGVCINTFLSVRVPITLTVPTVMYIRIRTYEPCFQGDDCQPLSVFIATIHFKAQFLKPYNITIAQHMQQYITD